ncbi:MAG: chromosome segregation protein SMC [Desulfuromonadia bacterium]
MKIKRLDIQGFKSFVDRVTFDFTAPISAIVGPNGCGKSNVVDAIRWVMGEQSAKNLRGKQMEDVIFNGSESRKPLGMAEVTIVFSTDDGRAPARYLDFAEIEVTRRLYRDGESEYLINRTPCRLMDITELFLDTGVGTKAYSIIEQGRIGTILLSRPEDRRFLIEEAAGVMKYKGRKQIALRKVETTRQNLQRLSDIIAEIRRRLTTLQNQAKKAEKFREMREELKGIDLAITARLLSTVMEKERELSRLDAEKRERLARCEARMGTIDATLQTLRISLLQREEALQRGRESLFTTKGKVIDANGEIERLRDRLRSLEALIAEADQEAALLAPRIESAREELQRLTESSSFLLVEHGEDDAAAAEILGRLESLQSRERGTVPILEELRRSLFAAQGDRARGTNQIQSCEKRRGVVTERLKRLERDREECLSRLAASSERLAAAEKELQLLTEAREEERRLLEDARSREKEQLRLERELSPLLDRARTALARSEARLSSLKDLARRYAGFGEGVRAVLTSPETAPLFHGTIADFVEVPSHLEGAVAAAISDRLQILIGKGGESISAASALLTDKGGRVSILAEPLITPSLPSPADTPRLVDHLTIDPRHAPWIAPLLERTYLVRDRDDAMTRAPSAPDAIFVTPDGEVVFAGGVVGIGRSGGGDGGILQTRREIREAEKDVVRLSRERDALEQRHREALTTLDAIRRERDERQKNLHSIELRLLTAEKDLQRVRGETSHLTERLSVITLEGSQLAEEGELLDREIADSQSLVEAAVLRADESGKRLEELESSRESLRSEIDAARQELTAIQIRIATAREQRLSAERTMTDLTARIAEMEERHARRLAEGEKARIEKRLLEEELVTKRSALARLADDLATCEKALVTAQEEYDAISMEARRWDDEHASLRKEMERIHEEISSLRIEQSEQAAQRATIETTLLERYRLTIPEFLEMIQRGEIHSPPDSDRREELLRRIDQIGEVNLTAIEEFQETRSRYDFLVSQKDDLEESLHSLQQAIQKINRTTRKRFLETFNQINEKFQEVFPRLFCGGSAELRLTNEEDLLETGIDIIVQPPGKRLQNVSLLSGGEKALTAVALVFSIFLIKPTPFCLLDEVDAPLDDANIGRFNDLIREMSAISQFILITHSKTTMTVADTLYGVTMEEAGVSKLVSVKIS